MWYTLKNLENETKAFIENTGNFHITSLWADVKHQVGILVQTNHGKHFMFSGRAVNVNIDWSERLDQQVFVKCVRRW